MDDLPNLSPIKESVPTYVLRHNSNTMKIDADMKELMKNADELGKKLYQG